VAELVDIVERVASEAVTDVVAAVKADEHYAPLVVSIAQKVLSSLSSLAADA
jgi:disulfide oxidoreductase YuzD